MSSMIEKVARAMTGSFDKMGVYEKRQWLETARMGVEAMREPTEEMVIAGCHHENIGDMAGRWAAMIDAALSDHQSDGVPNTNG